MELDVIERDLGGIESARILVLADAHIGEHLHDKRTLSKFIEEVKEVNTYCIVNGDLIDNATKGSIGDTYTANMSPDRQIDYLVEILEPIKDKILVMINGNHEERSKSRGDGIDIVKRVSRELQIPQTYADDGYILFVSLGENLKRKDRRTTYSILGVHGSGGGKRAGSTANNVEDLMSIADTDIYLHSHTHLPMSFRYSFVRCHYKTKTVKQVDKLFVNSSAMLKWGGYAKRKKYKIASQIYPKIFLKGEHREAQALI